MRLYLIRHGETVDNVANLYAGSRDSELTNHGFQQASRLGEHFRNSDVKFTHIFSSHLKRAVKTAEAIRVAQPEVHDGAGDKLFPVVKQLPYLAEQDFGSYEGVSFLARVPGSDVSGKEAHRVLHKGDPEFVDVESKESMIRRVDLFLDNDLLPIVEQESSTALTVAVVSHGIALSVLWRRLLQRLPSKSVTVDPEILSSFPRVDLERLGGWTNTGYLELDVIVRPLLRVSSTKDTVLVSQKVAANQVGPITIENKEDPLPAHTTSSTTSEMTPSLLGWTVAILAINSRKHLTGLKRTRGGVGSSRHDEKQKSIETFFKRRKEG